ncbi:mediator of RNA polymerase II transcription subunit 27-like isoform X1 [Mytilus galloprovincialis]|nr:mediator of RNA polymerase II transcription subunit 27 [Mytilus galloprovincialis]
MGDQEAEKLIHAIKLTQKLRGSVTKVFTDLSNGQTSTKEEEKEMLEDLQKSLLSMNDNLSDLEKISQSLPSTVHQTSNNISLVCLDPATDRTQLPSQLIHAHKWTNKVNRLSDYACQALQQATLRRTNKSQVGPGLSTKRQRRMPPVAHNIPASTVETVLNSLEKHLPDTSITVSRPNGSSCVLQITLSKTLKAVCVLRGFLIEYVNVKGYNEDFLSNDGKIDLWSKSRYKVFEKVSDLMMAGIQHYYYPQMPEITIRTFIQQWFNSYKTLFSAPCSKCGKHLQGGLPPVWRDFRTLAPLHDGCR